MIEQHASAIIAVLTNLVVLAYFTGRYSSRLERVEKKTDSHDVHGTVYSQLVAQSVRTLQESIAQIAARENAMTATLHRISEDVAVIRTDQRQLAESLRTLPCHRAGECEATRVQT